MGLEAEQLSLNEARANAKKLRQANTNVSNESMLQEIVKRDAVVDKNKSRKQRQKEEQNYKSASSEKVITEDIEITETEQDIADEIANVEVWDFEELQE